MLHTLAVPLAAVALIQPAPDDQTMDWTGVLDEESFAALHELTSNDAPDLLGDDVEVGGMDCYLSAPQLGESLGAVIVIHEWWGLNDHVKHWADRLASDGYTALAIDLYDGTVATTREDALATMRSVKSEEALEKLLAAHEYLSSSDGSIKAERTACIGWCFGGGWSLQLAMAEPELDAAVIYYGRLVTDVEKLKDIEANVLGVFGNEDTGIPPEAVAKFEEAMDSAGNDIRIRQYDAAHAFGNPSSARYDAENAALAWRETRTFLVENMWPEQASGSFGRKTRDLGMWVPDGWTKKEVGAFSTASFSVDSNSKCTVTFLGGEGGGVLANMNRWNMQMGASEFSETDIDELPVLPVLGVLAPTMRAEGSYTPMGGDVVDDAALVATIALLDGEAAFIKLIGPREEVEAATADYAAFCRNLR